LASELNRSATARAGRREWTALAVLALPTLLVSMDLTVLQLAMSGEVDEFPSPSTHAVISYSERGNQRE
jgi:hypothetical protein